jgi:dockerin type I repeat protein
MKGYRNRDQCWVLARRALIAFVLCADIACLFGSATQPAMEKVFRRNLTIADRAAYQRAIEEVYWRHRIWPKDNPEPKPPLDVVIPKEEVQNKVTNYLRKSQSLADYWQHPITAAQLQVEMDRMAHHTGQPDVLREIFAALGNDPFVIAECLGRPILAERMLTEREGGSSAPPLDGKSDREAIKNSWPSAVTAIARGAADPPETDPTSIKTQLDNTAYKLPEISVPLDCTDDTWIATTISNAPDGRSGHTIVWTGIEMIVWGGYPNLRSGARYTPSTDSWTTTTSGNAPVGRYDHTAVWTGSDMIVWGGYSGGYLNTGGKYNPSANTWTPTGTATAPIARRTHTAVWTGTEMIVWGGNSGNLWNTGARYNPTNDVWMPTNTTNAPVERAFHTAIWSGVEMIVWGGARTGYLSSGGRYDPKTDSWIATTSANAPSARFSNTTVWTGNEMVVWGGYDGSYLDTGGRYNPTSDNWLATNTNGAPSGRNGHSAIWTGGEMIVWGGYDGSDVNTGARYDLNANSWKATNTGANVPVARSNHRAVWTGSEMIVWGGGFLNTGGRYCAQPSAPIVQRAGSRKTHGDAGRFDVNLPLSGPPGIECRGGGSATGDYTIVVNFLANVSVDGSPQATVTSGIGTIGSGGADNGGKVITTGNVVTIPLTNVTNAQTINVTLNNVNGSTNVTIPMRVLIGDVNGNGTVNATDVGQTKSCVGQAVSATNFRCDVNAGGAINAADVSVVKFESGTGLP